MTWLQNIGKYYILMARTFSKPEKWSIYREQFFKEVDKLGIGSIGLVSIISVFMGAVICIQSAFGFESPWIPLYAVGVSTRDIIILEFSPTVVCLILAGKVGSNIAGELGTMRVTEQIDALEIMGINSSAYLIMPKIVAAVCIFPFLVVISMFLGVFGGYLAGVAVHAVTSYEYIYGITYDFNTYYITYALIKSLVFAFIITSVSAFYGYYTEGGALEVGRQSTKAVVYSSILILLANVLITQLLLS
jgi:phospholipid/cholesterol/gamma-HCH transport system permease protein